MMMPRTAPTRSSPSLQQLLAALDPPDQEAGLRMGGLIETESRMACLRARPETRSGRVQVPYRADRRSDFRCATGTLSPPRDPFDITRPAPSEFPDGLSGDSSNAH